MISIVICTYNRSSILQEVIMHIIENVEGVKSCELIIVDNNSTDNTLEVITRIKNEYSSLVYYLEKNQGLSFARNRGISEANQEYILFLDDDALPKNDIILKMQYYLENNKNIKALGGVYIPWYKYGKPIWFKDKYASKKFKYSGLHELDKTDELCGGVMLFHKSVFEKYGVFDINLGMKKDKLFYGEESEFQNRLKTQSVKIYGSDDLIIEHVVQEYKLKISWFFEHKKEIGISQAMMYKGIKWIGIIKGFLLFLGQALLFPIINCPKTISNNYYRQNFIIDSFSKPWKWYNYSKKLLSLK